MSRQSGLPASEAEHVSAAVDVDVRHGLLLSDVAAHLSLERRANLSAERTEALRVMMVFQGF